MARKVLVVALIAAVVGLVGYLVFRPGPEPVAAVGPAASPEAVSPTAVVVPEDVEIIPASPDALAAEDAARQALTVAWTWYPATDETKNIAWGRARNLLTPQLADRMIIDASTERGQGVQWDQWAANNAKVIADVIIGCDDCPPDTDTVIRRVATIRQTAITGTRADTLTPDTTVWVTMVREDDRWLLDEIKL